MESGFAVSTLPGPRALKSRQASTCKDHPITGLKHLQVVVDVQSEVMQRGVLLLLCGRAGAVKVLF